MLFYFVCAGIAAVAVYGLWETWNSWRINRPRTRKAILAAAAVGLLAAPVAHAAGRQGEPGFGSGGGPRGNWGGASDGVRSGTSATDDVTDYSGAQIQSTADHNEGTDGALGGGVTGTDSGDGACGCDAGGGGLAGVGP